MLFHRMAVATICDSQWKVMDIELTVKHALISSDDNDVIDVTHILNQLYINKQIFSSTFYVDIFTTGVQVVFM